MDHKASQTLLKYPPPPEIIAERTNWAFWEWPIYISEGEGGQWKYESRVHSKLPTLKVANYIFPNATPLPEKRGLILLTTHVLHNVLMQSFQEMDPLQVCLDNIDKQFKPYNRER